MTGCCGGEWIVEMVDGREMCVHIEFAVLCKEFERIW